MMQLYLRKKIFRSSLFFLTPLFLPQWGKLNTTRSNTRPWREAHSPSFLQSTPNSTAPPEQTHQEKRVYPNKIHRSTKVKVLTNSYLSSRWPECYRLRLHAAVPPPDSADKWPLCWSLFQSVTGSERQNTRSSLLPPVIWTVKETCAVQMEMTGTQKLSFPRDCPEICSPFYSFEYQRRRRAWERHWPPSVFFMV